MPSNWMRALLAAAALMAGAAAPARSADLPVDLELVLAVDVSGSMDIREQRLQRAGYVAALTDPSVLRAIAGGNYRRIAITYVEWAGAAIQYVAVPWRLIDGEPAARNFANSVASIEYNVYRGTSVSGALAFSSGLFAGNGFEGMRRVIDISGDGPNNQGNAVAPIREAIIDNGIVINGLPLLLDPSQVNAATGNGLDAYYEDCVIGGPGSFMIAVTDVKQFAEAIRQKLILEIAGLEPTIKPVSQRDNRRRVNCMLTEFQRVPF